MVDHLVTSSQNDYGVELISKNNMVIITSGHDVHWHTDQNMLKGKVRTVNRENIRVLVDENVPFWVSLQRSATAEPNR